MGKMRTADGRSVSDEMIEKWTEALDNDEWPEGWVNVGDIIEGALAGDGAVVEHGRRAAVGKGDLSCGGISLGRSNGAQQRKRLDTGKRRDPEDREACANALLRLVHVSPFSISHQMHVIVTFQ